MSISSIAIEVVYALPERQTLLKLRVPVGSTVGAALGASRIVALHPEIDLAQQRVGLFGQFVDHDHVLGAGNRIEIYRPLIADPKASRHERVARKRAERDSDRNMRA